MGTHWLIPHPETPSGVVQSIEVEAEVQDGEIWFRFIVTGDPLAVALPAPASPARTDGLWQATCFEAFIELGNGPAYDEYNFSPSGEWAAYRFTGTREGMADLDLPCIPYVYLEPGEGRFEVAANIPLPEGVEGGRLALSAVIADIDGTLSYWALAHAPGKPDFHHPACFAAQLAAPSAA